MTEPVPPSTLTEIARRVRAERLTYLSEAKFDSLIRALNRVRTAGVIGDFVEFGVALGGSAACIASALDGDRAFVGFDVFGMIPPPGEKDGEKPNERYAVIKSGQSKGIGGDAYYGYNPDLLATVKAAFARYGLPPDEDKVRFVEGRYEDTLPRQKRRPVAFAHVDCDWYDSVRVCLDFLRINLSRGGVVVFDDYNDWPGCKLAVDEFLAAEPGFHMVRSNPHAVVVRRTRE